jgi:APA family basic amino acid/polyamine antiporter
MGYADVGADIYVAIGLVALFAGGASPLAFLIASITYIATGLAYSELATTYPYAGGAHIYAMKAFNDLTGFIAGWAVMLDYTVDMALFSLASAGYLSYFVPSIKTGHFIFRVFGSNISIPHLGLVAGILVIFLLLINVFGIEETEADGYLLVFLMKRRARRGWRGLFTRSVSQRVVRDAECLVLTAPLEQLSHRRQGLSKH